MAATYTLWRSVDASFRFPSPIATGLAASPFTDLNVLPGVLYYYQVTESNAGAVIYSNLASATAPVPVPTLYPKTTMSTRIFSTGTLFIDTGAGPIELATLQEISWEMPFQEKELRAAPWINMFAESRAFYGGKMTLKAKHATIHAEALAAVTGGTNVLPVAANPGAQPPTAAVPGVMTVGKTAILPPFFCCLHDPGRSRQRHSADLRPCPHAGTDVALQTRRLRNGRCHHDRR